jgi:general secretion pathway protein B
MSYILDALKKMEHEKVKKARSGGMTSISGELFREERPRSPRGGAMKVIAVAVVTACVAMAATWFYLKPDKAHQKAFHRRSAPPAAPAATALPTVPTPQSSVQQQPQPPLAPPAVLPAQTTVPPPYSAATLQKGSVPPPQAAAAPAPAVSKPAAQPAPRKADSITRERSTRPALVTSEVRTAGVTIAPPADIKVSGIAWQEERSARRAVINGFLMKEGGVVAGARITEIRPDRVRFSAPGGEFELSMVASGIPGASK